MTFGDLILTPLLGRHLPAGRRRHVRRRAEDAVGEACAGRRPNRIRLACGRCWCRASRRMLIDAGIGDKMDAKSTDIYAHRSLAEPRPFAGGCRARAATPSTSCSPRTCISITPAASRRATAPAVSCRAFRARATSCATAEWDDATHPHERNRASYLKENFVPLADAGVLDLVAGDATDHAGRPGRAHRRPHQAPSDRRHRVRRTRRLSSPPT